MKWPVVQTAALTVSLTVASAQYQSRQGQGSTRTSGQGQAVQCIDMMSQVDGGQLATKPKPPARHRKDNGTAYNFADNIVDCPKGTVPRAAPLSLSNCSAKKRRSVRPIHPRAEVVAQGTAYHAGVATSGSSSQGGGGIFLVAKPPMRQCAAGTSVLQMAFTHSAGTGSHRQQTVEAGLTLMPQAADKQFLFTYYTNTAHASDSDGTGGYNGDHGGWVQVCPELYPGMMVDSPGDGTERDIEMMYILDQGNWWLWVQDRFIGYYPGSLFNNGLASGAQGVTLFGEVFAMGGVDTGIPMGTGVLPTDSQGTTEEPSCHGATYIRNMFQINGNSGDIDLDANTVLTHNSYAITKHMSSTPWGSFICVGGPNGGSTASGSSNSASAYSGAAGSSSSGNAGFSSYAGTGSSSSAGTGASYSGGADASYSGGTGSSYSAGTGSSYSTDNGSSASDDTESSSSDDTESSSSADTESSSSANTGSSNNGGAGSS
ncbi:hypothetical protein DCS_01854 [Drechmeria coniospora]|uniref:Neprosin PEP catalytic domain-containing protein n=1 Tax=Drechmeria coniospora TaxID=98403 RepID=A0A151GUC4_DRECN|nr:hypothetical protein DCS_01854 [Drechmeria coniospora]KYK60716.1 hypothetical protein DCS_01854 [Drechmeria coniospora]